MAYTSPTSVQDPTTNAAILTAWGDATNAASDYLATNKPHARVYKSTAFSHNSTGNWLSITFDSERVDVGGCHSTVSNTSRLTVPSGEGGWYDIGGCFEFAANATGHRLARILLNGATVIAQVGPFDATSAFSTALNPSTKYQLAAADYVELQGYQNSGGSLNISASGNYSPEFWLEWKAT